MRELTEIYIGIPDKKIKIKKIHQMEKQTIKAIYQKIKQHHAQDIKLAEATAKGLIARKGQELIKIEGLE